MPCGLADDADRERATALVAVMAERITELAPRFPHDADYLAALPVDLQRWVDGGFGVPDFLDSLMAFRPDQHRVDGAQHLVRLDPEPPRELARVGGAQGGVADLRDDGRARPHGAQPPLEAVDVVLLDGRPQRELEQRGAGVH